MNSTATLALPSAATNPTTIAGYFHRHAGETILVCGCGRSLQNLPGEHGLITIGVNDVGRSFDPTYLVVLNPASQFEGDRYGFIQESRARAVFSQLPQNLAHAPLIQFQLGQRNGTVVDASGRLPFTRNSPYVALALAAFLGASRIGLIGVDFTQDHFFGATGRHTLHEELPQVDAEYRALGKSLAAMGIEVFNLSLESRLTAFEKMEPEAFLAQTGTALTPVQKKRTASRAEKPARKLLTVCLERHAPGIIGDLFDALALSLEELGHPIQICTRRGADLPGDIAFVWNGRQVVNPPPRGIIYCEHAWLPRWWYQLSPRGINADSHVGPFQWDGRALKPAEKRWVLDHLMRLRHDSPDSHAYMKTGLEPLVDLPEAFFLVPFQVEQDTNIIRHVPPMFRNMQTLVDYISWHDPNLPIIFKQHPADARRGDAHLKLVLRRRQDRLYAHNQGNIHQILKSGRCKGIFSLNSNVVHDGLIWDVPSVVLGNNIWPRGGPSPFARHIPRDWRELADFAAKGQACRLAYCLHLMRNQWRIEDARDPQKIQELLDTLTEGPAPNTLVVPDPPDSTRSRALAGAGKSRPAYIQPVARVTTINFAARNIGGLFEELKHLAEKITAPDFRVIGSDRPLADADAWIFPRTKEARNTPDPSRTVVQIHDLWDEGRYLPGAERAIVKACGGLVLSHPGQKDILRRNHIDFNGIKHFCRPLGALSTFAERQSLHPTFTIGWVGRTLVRAGSDLSRTEWLPAIAASLAHRESVRFLLMGEHLDQVAHAIGDQGVACDYEPRGRTDSASYPRFYSQMDVLLITSGQEAGPMPLFEAMATGVPVIGTEVGWVPDLIEQGRNGFIAADPDGFTAFLEQIFAERRAWFEKRAAIRAVMAPFRLESWLRETIDLALSLCHR